MKPARFNLTRSVVAVRPEGNAIAVVVAMMPPAPVPAIVAMFTVFSASALPVMTTLDNDCIGIGN